MTRQITTVEQLDALPAGTVMRARTGELCETGTIPSSNEPCVWSTGWLDHAGTIEHLAPLTILYVPGEQEPRPLPDRDQIAKAIASGYEPDHPDPNHHDYRAADAVLELIR